MTEEKKPAAKKSSAAKAATAGKAAPKKESAAPKKVAAAKAVPAKKPAAEKKVIVPGAKVTIKQTGSPARSEQWAYQTLAGLGLGKMNRVRTLEDTPSVRGMINRVHHLVTVQDTAA